MKLTAITMVRDEVDVIERTMRHLRAQGVDEILLLENASTDGTWEILRDLRDTRALEPMHLVIYPDHEVGYYQSRKMTGLARAALAGGADWIIPFDADELWQVDHRVWTQPTSDPSSRRPVTLREFFSGAMGLPGGSSSGIVSAPILNHYRTDADPGGHPFDAMGWRSSEPLPLPKVAVPAAPFARPAATIEAGNHGASGVGPGRFQGLEVRHFPYRSPEQFLRKARNGSEAYAATDLPRSTGQHWREWGEALREHGEAGLREWFRAFTYGDDPEQDGLVFDPVPSPL